MNNEEVSSLGWYARWLGNISFHLLVAQSILNHTEGGHYDLIYLMKNSGTPTAGLLHAFHQQSLLHQTSLTASRALSSAISAEA